MPAGVKLFLMALGTAAWAGLVTFFHGVDVGTAPSVTEFHSLIASLVASIVPAIVAYIMNPPQAPAPPAPPAA